MVKIAVSKLIASLLSGFLLVLCCGSSIHPIYAHSFETPIQSNIPDIGQSGAWLIDSTQEKIMGGIMMQQINAADYVTSDTVVNEYLRILSERIQASAPPIDFKLRFFCVESSVLNAFAFFGGYVAVHSGLILAAETESELAAVLAHETAHITQRHLARILTNNKKMMPITAAEIIGALALGIFGGSPEAGMHLATAALGSHVQNLIHYTRLHEQEADRMGIQILAKAGFNPHGMSSMFKRLNNKTQYQIKPPEYFQTHPMFEERIADASNRADKMNYQPKPDSLFFHLVRARILAGSQDSPKKRVQRISKQLQMDPPGNKTPLEYALALSQAKNRQYPQAEELMQKLVERHPEEWLFKFSQGEIAREKNDFKAALEIFKKLMETYPQNYAISFAYVDTLLDNKQALQAKSLITKLKKEHTEDPFLIQLLAKTYSQLGKKSEVHQMQAEWHTLRGEFKEAFQQLDLALEYVDKQSHRATIIKDKKKNLEEDFKEQQKLM